MLTLIDTDNRIWSSSNRTTLLCMQYTANIFWNFSRYAEVNASAFPGNLGRNFSLVQIVEDEL